MNVQNAMVLTYSSNEENVLNPEEVINKRCYGD